MPRSTSSRTVALRLFLAAVAATALGCSAGGEDTDEGASAAAVSAGPGAEPRVGFICECKASAPGFEDQTGAKQCSYGCVCDVLTASGMTKVAPFSIGPLATSAASWQSWDRGSHICHGQYATWPSLQDAGDPSRNWTIKVKLGAFKMTQFGYTGYASESTETAPGLTETFTRTRTAPEIRDAIAKKLGVEKLPPL